VPLHAPLRPAVRTPGRYRARHAAPGPASTPLTGLTEAVAARAGVLARRGVVVAASTGLAMTMGVTASSAQPVGGEPHPEPALTAPAERVEAPALAVTEALTVAVDVPVTFTRGAAPSVTAPPPPPPPPAPVVEDEPAVVVSSRSEDSDSDESDEDDSPRAEETVSRSAQRVAVVEDSSSSDEGSSEQSGSGESSSDESGSDSSSEDSGSDESSSDESGSVEAPAAPASSSAGSSVLDIAAQYVGTPYVYGGTSPSGFDCSGFTQYVFAQAGISLPRTAAAQGAAGTRVSRSEARPGDLAVVSDGSHVGIYAGGNQWYDSPRPGKSVSLRDIWTSDVYFVRY